MFLGQGTQTSHFSHVSHCMTCNCSKSSKKVQINTRKVFGVIAFDCIYPLSINFRLQRVFENEVEKRHPSKEKSTKTNFEK